jgi:hypothetical protein
MSAWPIPPGTPEAAEAIERVKRGLRGERIGPGPQPRPSKPISITIANACEYERDGKRCGRRGSSRTDRGFRCTTHRFV